MGVCLIRLFWLQGAEPQGRGKGIRPQEPGAHLEWKTPQGRGTGILTITGCVVSPPLCDTFTSLCVTALPHPCHQVL